MQNDTSNPLKAWNMKEVTAFSTKNSHQQPLQNDLYGHLNYFLRHHISKLHRALRDRPFSITLYTLDLSILYRCTDPAFFDRIDVSDVIDRGYLGLDATLGAVRPLLRPTNKHATVLGLFIHAMWEMDDRNKLNVKTLKSSMTHCQKYIQDYPVISPFSAAAPQVVLMAAAKAIFAPVEKWYGEYAREVHMEEVSRANKLKVKESNSVVAKWPYRLKKKYGEVGAQAEFEELLASDLVGFERYVEWSAM